MERLSYSRDVYLISENVSSLAEQFQVLRFGNHNGMLRDFVGGITLCRIRLQFGQDVPDSGQEHSAHSDDLFLVPVTSLDSAVAFLAFGIFVGFDDGVGDLNQQRFQVATGTGDAGRFHADIRAGVFREPVSQILQPFGK